MIVRDAEATLEAAIVSAAPFCDEFIVVDTGSIDRSREIARSLGATVTEFEWIDDFAAARNESFARCQGEWIFWMDADDIVPAAAVAGFLELKSALRGRMDVDAAFTELRSINPATGEITLTNHRERVLRRAAGLRWTSAIHETVDIETDRAVSSWPTAWIEDRVTQDRAHSDRNLKILRRELDSGNRSARILAYLGHEFRGRERWGEAIEFYEEYLTAYEPNVWARAWNLFWLGSVYRQIAEYDESSRVLTQAIGVDPTRAEAFVELGELHYERKQWRQALPFFMAATAIATPQSGLFLNAHYTWFPWDRISICYSELGNLDAAIRATHNSLATAPDLERDRLVANLSFYYSKIRLPGS